MKISRHFTCSGRRKAAAFSLVEIALALGIVGFALVGIVGAIPVAVNNERLSVAQTRAAALANTFFTNCRTQPFGAVQYIDPTPGSSTTAGLPTLNLNTLKTATGDSPKVTFYAAFTETVSTTPPAVPDARRLLFSVNVPATTPYYLIVLRFDNNPSGTLVPYTMASGAMRAQANAIEASISESDRPKDVFHFSSVIANRLE